MIKLKSRGLLFLKLNSSLFLLKMFSFIFTNVPLSTKNMTTPKYGID